MNAGPCYLWTQQNKVVESPAAACLKFDDNDALDHAFPSSVLCCVLYGNGLFRHFSASFLCLSQRFAASAGIANAAIAASRDARVVQYKIQRFIRLHLVPHHRGHYC
eukprot:scaffold476501_cov17-Prasinocladus_malaysianus.AAC.1